MNESQLSIKQMKPQQIAQVIKLQNECGFDGWERPWYEENLAASSVICLGASINEHLVGFITAQVLADEIELYLICVSSVYRRQQIGTLLLKNLHALAMAKHLRAIFLEVRSSNLPAQKLYQSLGFSLAGVRHNYYQNPVEDAYILRCEI